MYTVVVRTKNPPLRNVTLSAPADRIDKARQIARAQGQTLNDAFRHWLDGYVARPDSESFDDFVKRLGDLEIGPLPDREARNFR